MYSYKQTRNRIFFQRGVDLSNNKQHNKKTLLKFNNLKI